HSIVTNARLHERQAVVVNLDIRQFFPQTSDTRIEAYFRRIGWNKSAARLLTRLVTHDGASRPARPPARASATSSITAWMRASTPPLPLMWLLYTREIARAEDVCYRRLRDTRRVLRRARHQQRVTGLVVTDRARLPRRTRRWLRAVEHRLRTNPAAATLTQT